MFFRVQAVDLESHLPSGLYHPVAAVVGLVAVLVYLQCLLVVPVDLEYPHMDLRDNHLAVLAQELIDPKHLKLLFGLDRR